MGNFEAFHWTGIYFPTGDVFHSGNCGITDEATEVHEESDVKANTGHCTHEKNTLVLSNKLKICVTECKLVETYLYLIEY